jgi:hypothetical protein
MPESSTVNDGTMVLSSNIVTKSLMWAKRVDDGTVVLPLVARTGVTSKHWRRLADAR